eukprot:gene19402-25275_t
MSSNNKRKSNLLSNDVGKDVITLSTDKKINTNANTVADEEITDYNNDRTVYVEGLPFTANEQIIRDFFLSAGPIKSVRLPTWHDSGRLRGYGHVEFNHSESAEKALGLDGGYIGERFIKVDRPLTPKILQRLNDNPTKISRPIGCKSVFIKNLSYDCTDDEVREALKVCGPINEIRLAMWNHTKQLKGFGYVDFKREESAEIAVKKSDSLFTFDPLPLPIVVKNCDIMIAEVTSIDDHRGLDKFVCKVDGEIGWCFITSSNFYFELPEYAGKLCPSITKDQVLFLSLNERLKADILDLPYDKFDLTAVNKTAVILYKNYEQSLIESSRSVDNGKRIEYISNIVMSTAVKVNSLSYDHSIMTAEKSNIEIDNAPTSVATTVECSSPSNEVVDDHTPSKTVKPKKKPINSRKSPLKITDLSNEDNSVDLRQLAGDFIARGSNKFLERLGECGWTLDKATWSSKWWRHEFIHLPPWIKTNKLSSRSESKLIAGIDYFWDIFDVAQYINIYGCTRIPEKNYNYKLKIDYNSEDWNANVRLLELADCAPLPDQIELFENLLRETDIIEITKFLKSNGNSESQRIISKRTREYNASATNSPKKNTREKSDPKYFRNSGSLGSTNSSVSEDVIEEILEIVNEGKSVSFNELWPLLKEIGWLSLTADSGYVTVPPWTKAKYIDTKTSLYEKNRDYFIDNDDVVSYIKKHGLTKAKSPATPPSPRRRVKTVNKDNDITKSDTIYSKTVTKKPNKPSNSKPVSSKATNININYNSESCFSKEELEIMKVIAEVDQKKSYVLPHIVPYLVDLGWRVVESNGMGNVYLPHWNVFKGKCFKVGDFKYLPTVDYFYKDEVVPYILKNGLKRVEDSNHARGRNREVCQTSQESREGLVPKAVKSVKRKMTDVLTVQSPQLSEMSNQSDFNLNEVSSKRVRVSHKDKHSAPYDHLYSIVNDQYQSPMSNANYDLLSIDSINSFESSMGNEESTLESDIKKVIRRFSSNSGEVIGRDSELNTIIGQISSCFESRHGCMYMVCGAPGQGKSFTVQAALKKLSKGHHFNHIHMQGPSQTDGKFFFQTLHDRLQLSSSASGNFKEIVMSHFDCKPNVEVSDNIYQTNSVNKSNDKVVEMTILTVDEFDMLSPTVIEDLKQITGRSNCALTVIGTSNDISFGHQHEIETVVFSNYTDPDTFVKIINRDAAGLFEDKAALFIAKKVLGSMKGDFRSFKETVISCLEMLLVKIKDKEKEIVFSPSGEFNIHESKPVVNLDIVRSLPSLKTPVSIIETLPPLTLSVLCAAIVISKSSDDPVTLENVTEQMKLFNQKYYLDSGVNQISSDEIMRQLEQLSDVSLLQSLETKKTRHRQTVDIFSASKRSSKHIAPRIDSTFYQAEISDLIVDKTSEFRNNHKHQSESIEASTRVSSCTKQHQLAVEEFICVVRNLLSNIRLDKTLNWSQSQCKYPLDSDELAIEYLAKHGYDVSNATNHMLCDLTSGKDQISTDFTAFPVSKCSNTSAFAEYLSRLNKHRGSMHGSFQSTNEISSEQIISNNGISNGNNKRSNVFTYLKSPEASTIVTAIAVEDSNSDFSQPEIYLEDELESTYVGSGRSVRTGERDKQEIRKKWHSLFDEISAVIKHPFQSSVSYAQRLIEEAASLPAYPNAIGEDFADMIKSSLGETVKEVMEARRWSSHVRDVSHHLADDNCKEDPVEVILKLLSQAKQLALVPHDYLYWTGVVKEADKLTTDMTKFNKRMQFQSEPNKISISVLNDWIKRCEILPLYLSQSSAIRNVLKSAEDIYATVRSTLLSRDLCLMRKPKIRDSIRVSFDDALALQNSVKVSTGENFPFLLEEELEVLRDKKNNAKLWLDKLKKTFQSTSGSRRTNNSSGDHDNLTVTMDNKVDLEEMKLLVLEGQGLFDDGLIDDNKIRNKELNKAKSIVDLADSWLEKFRDMLGSGNDDGNNTIKDESELLADLRLALEEANQLPVVMDEILVLNCHVHALEWSIKAKKILPSLNNFSHNTYDSETSSLIKQAELMKLNKEIEKIRSSLPDSISDFYPLRELPEEMQCKQLVKQVNDWNDEVKKIVQNNSIRKGTSMSVLKRLFVECYNIPVNLENEVKPVKVAILAACEWTKKNLSILSRLGISSSESIVSTDSSALSILKSMETEDFFMETEDFLSVFNNLKDRRIKPVIAPDNIGLNESFRADSEDINIKEDKNIEIKSEEWNFVGEILSQELDEINVHSNTSSQLVSYAELQHLVSSSSSLNAEFDEASIAKSYLDDLETWLQSVMYALDGSTESLTAMSIASTRGRKTRYKNTNKETNDAPIRSIHYLSKLLSQSNTLKVSIESEKKKIEDLLSASLKWNSETNCTVDTQLTERLNKLEVKVSAEDEERLFDDFSDGFNFIHDLTCQSDKKNIVTNISSLTLQAMLLTKDWITAVRAILSGEWMKSHRGQELWGDFDISIIDDLLASGNYLINTDSSNYDGIDRGDNISDRLNEITLLATSLTEEWSNQFQSLQEHYTSKLGSITRRKDKSGVDSLSNEDIVEETVPAIQSKQRNIKRNRMFEDFDRDFKLVKRKKLVEDSKENEVQIESTEAVDSVTEDYRLSDKPVFKCQEYVATIVKSIKSFTKQLNSYLKDESQNLKPQENRLIPINLSKILQLWLLQLQLFKYRLNECKSLLNYSDSLLRKSSNTSRKPLSEDIVEILKLSECRHILCHEMTEVKNSFANAQIWTDRARKMLERDGSERLLNIEELKNFISEGETISYEIKELGLIRGEYRKAKAWYARLQKSGIDKYEASDKELEELVEESKLISVDLSEGIQQIQDSKLKYCICRQESHSEMIGCDTCKEWYHYSCIGMTKIQADKLDKYSCVRCQLLYSFDQSAVAAGVLVNRWMNVDELINSNDGKRIKIQKRIQKENKELQKLEQQAKIHYALVTSNEPQSSLQADILMTSQSNNVEIREESQFQKILQDLSEVKKKLTASKLEESQLRKKREIEDSKREECQEWMHVMQRIIWPQTADEIQAGRPLGPNNPSGFNVSSLDKRVDDILLRSLVPEAIRRAAEAAMALGINEFEDVVALLENFRWMSWCNIMINALRGPLPSTILKRLVDSALLLKFADDKILKFFQSILAKSNQWKIKARKFYGSIRGTDHLLDAKKLTDIVLEGNGIPINSRLKTMFRKALDRLQTRSGGEGNERGRGRNFSSLSSSNSAQAILPNIDMPNSTDEDDATADVNNENQQTIGDRDEWFMYEDIKGLSLAPEPPDKWPLRMPFPALARSHLKSLTSTDITLQQNALNTIARNQLKPNKMVSSSVKPVMSINNKQIGVNNMSSNQVVTIQRKLGVASAPSLLPMKQSGHSNGMLLPLSVSQNVKSSSHSQIAHKISSTVLNPTENQLIKDSVQVPLPLKRSTPENIDGFSSDKEEKRAKVDNISNA